MTTDFHPGQRWISETEPELGLGSIVEVTHRRVTASFAATGEQRQYARGNAPLRRVRFRPGDKVKDRHEKPFMIESVVERDGLIYYRHGKRELCESELSDALTFNKPEERLSAGQFDATQVFDLRMAALEHQYRILKSKVRGFAG